MSVEAMSWVFRSERETEGTDRLVLLALADFSDAEGWSWPSVRKVAESANCSSRTVQRAIGRLEEMGLLVVEKQAGGTHLTRSDRRPNRYRIVTERGDTGDAPPVDSDGVTQAEPGDTAVTPSRGDTNERGDTGDVHGVTLLSPSSEEPPVNHHLSLGTAERDTPSQPVEPVGADGAERDPAKTATSALTILAARRWQAVEASRVPVVNEHGYRHAIRAELRATYFAEAVRSATQNPEWTAVELADWLEPIEPDRAVLRSVPKHDPDCPDCHGRGVFMPDDSDVAVECECLAVPA